MDTQGERGTLVRRYFDDRSRRGHPVGLILGLANWSDGSNATFAMGLLGIVPSGFCIWVLTTLLKRSGSRRSLGSE